MGVKKVQVCSDNLAKLSCPTCRAVRTAEVGQFKDFGNILSVKCVCNSKFAIKLEFRQHKRKPTNLDGYCIKSEVAGDFENSERNKRHACNCMIKNLSREGAGFVNLGKQQISTGSNVWLQFSLDDNNNTEITREAVVKIIQDDFVGCEFIPRPCGVEPALGFYLMAQSE